MDNPRCDDFKGTDTTGCFSFGDRLGLTFVAQMSAVSAIMVVCLLIVILVRGIQNSRRNGGQWPPHIFMYLVALLTADLVQALGALMDIRWVHLAGVRESAFCTTQGVLKQVGDVGVALASLAIAVQTWSIVAMRWPSRKSPVRAFVVIGVMVGFIAVLNGIGLQRHHSKYGPLYGNSGLWCTDIHITLIITIEYLWLWVSAGISIVLYVHVAIVLYLEKTPDSGSGFEEDKKTAAAENRKLALQMLYYPVIYVITVAPQSVVRLITLINAASYDPPNKPFPIAWQTFTAIVFGSSGALNVFLYTYTRPSLMASTDDETVLDDKGDTSAELDGQLQTTSFEMNPNRASTLHYAYDNPYRPVSAHGAGAEEGLGGLPD